MDLKEKIRVIEDFPKEGISFKDITTLIKDNEAFAAAVDEMAKLIDDDVKYIIGPEARGFIFSSALAIKLNKGFVPVRKPGKLPGKVLSYEYDLEYGTDTIEIHQDAIEKGDKVAIVDDLLATGGTLNATADAVKVLGGEVANIIALIELTGLNGRELLKEYKVDSLVEYEF